MQPDQLRRNTFFPLLIGILALGLALGFGAEYALTQPSVNQMQNNLSTQSSSISQQSSSINKLESDKASLQTKLNETDAMLSSLNQQLGAEQTQLTQAMNTLKNNQTQLTKLQAKLSIIQNATQKLNYDRILVGDLRTDVPASRADAILYWQSVKTHAVNADPTLGPSVDSILSTIDNYYNNFVYPLNNATTIQQVGQIYVSAQLNGALAYGQNIGSFQKDALLVVATSIEQIVLLTS